VILSPLTFLASANCLLYCGAVPVFADIDPATLNLDPVRVEAAVTSRTKAILPVHFAVFPATWTGSGRSRSHAASVSSRTRRTP